MKTMARVILCVPLLLVAAFSQVPDRRNAFTVAGAGLPASVTIPTSDQGVTLNRSLTASMLVIANTDSASHTVTVQDCQATPFKLFNAYPVPALTTWVVPLGGMYFAGCIKWSASSTLVMGSLVGQ